MDNSTIRKKNVVERYVLGTLGDDELTEFEIYMLDHPEVVDDIEYEQGMQDALKVAGQRLSGKKRSIWNIFHSTQYAVAATVLLGAALVFSALLYRELTRVKGRVLEAANPLVPTNEVWLEPMRGDRVWTVDAQPNLISIIRIDVSSTPSPSYTVVLNGETSSWTRSGIEPDTEQSVSLVLSNLRAGEYELAISSDTPDPLTTPFVRYQLLLR